MNREKCIAIAEKFIEYGFYGLIFFLPISKALIEVSAALIIIAFIFKKTITRDFTSFKVDAKIFWILLILFAFNALSLVNSGPFFLKSLRALVSKWAEYFLLFVIAIDHFRDRKLIKKFFYVFISSGMLVGLSVLSQKLFGFEFLRDRSMLSIGVTGPFENPNSLGAYLVCCLPAFIAIVGWKWKKKTIVYLVLLVCVILLASILLAFSRGGWLGFLIGILMLIVLGKRKKFPVLILSAFLSTLFLFPPFIKRIMFSFSLFGDSQRYIIWQGAIDMIKENPFLGKGLGTFMDYSSQYVPSMGAYYAHNCYLQIWAESGIFTLIAFLALAGFIVYRGIRISLRNKQDEFGILLAGLTSGIFGFLVVSFFDTQLYSLQLSVLFWTILGVTVSVQHILLDKA